MALRLTAERATRTAESADLSKYAAVAIATSSSRHEYSRSPPDSRQSTCSAAAVMTTSAPELAMLAAVGAPEPWRRRRSTRGSAIVAMGSDARASEFGSESSGWTAAGATVVGLQRDPRK